VPRPITRRRFNEERPHEALDLRVPHDVYQASPRRFDPAPVELVYPGPYLVRKVNQAGSVKVRRQRISVSTTLRGYDVGLEPRDQNRLAVWFCRLCLGEIDVSTSKFRAARQQPLPERQQ
jgi:putative transposase